ncbi:MAG: type II toxin-antitoxin system VapC family toxin [Balneolales bacterium]|nr:type II toxin-antitoxin system VapC family toxin [Balneolales bacterium]
MSEMVILDTHTLLWHASESNRLSTKAKKSIEAAEKLGISTISAWEIGMLVQKGRLSLIHDVSEWIELAGRLPKMEWIQVDTKIAVLSTRLPGSFHGDPADRIITATAMSRGAALITADRLLKEYNHVRTIW